LPELTKGYCALWSLFFLENVLKFKDMTVSELNQRLLEKYHTPVKLRKLMFSYSKKLSNILEKQTNAKLNEIINSIEKDELYRLNPETCHLIGKIKEKMNKNKLSNPSNYGKNNISNKEKELLVYQIIHYFFPEPVENDKNIAPSSPAFFNNLSSGTEYYLSENGKSIKSSTRSSSSKNKLTSFTKNV
jgi:hypothetical protein